MTCSGEQEGLIRQDDATLLRHEVQELGEIRLLYWVI